MKRLIYCIFCFATIPVVAQTNTGKIPWKDVSGNIYVYSGQLLNGKPDGKGYAVCTDKGIRIFGDFKNGLIDGRASMIYNDGRILTGQWKNGYANGKCVYVRNDINVIYGTYVNGELNGPAMEVHANMLQFAMKRGIQNQGRAISVYDNGTTMVDAYYEDGVRSGPGYRYDAEKKTMEEGIWKEGYLSKTVTGNYPSFMRKKLFGSLVNSQGSMIWSDSSNQQMQDTGFLFMRDSKTRGLGYFTNGFLTNGIKVVGDSFRMMGHWNMDGMQGVCLDQIRGVGLHFGNFRNSNPHGQGISIQLNPLKIIDGNFDDGNISGSACILADDGTFSIGLYKNNSLIGEAFTVNADGSSTGKLVSIPATKQTEKPGKKNQVPGSKDVCDAVNFLVKAFEDNFQSINTHTRTEASESSFVTSYSDALNSSFAFPGASFSWILPDRPGLGNIKQNEFTCGIILSNDYGEIKKQYDQLCKQLSACLIISLQKGKKLKLISLIRPLVPDTEDGRLASLFTVPVHDGKKNTAVVRIMVEKNDNNSYQLTLDVISKW